ncbi:hypothetical protein L6241_04690 [Janibacter sp. Y6]|uniref:hypothetical protein n=1 Tax=Janibacter sp. Y6 TaxID=2913552 RepID=UPI0034A131A5
MRVDSTHVVEVTDEEDGLAPILDPDLLAEVGPVAFALLKSFGLHARKVYELSPESADLLIDARLDTVGSYFRGVLRSDKGQVSHQLQLREVEARTFSAIEALTAVQLLVIQQQLRQIKVSVDAVTRDVRHVVRALEIEQRSQVEAALDTVRRVRAIAGTTGAVDDSDWSRVAHLEQVFKATLLGVENELLLRLNGATFGASPQADATAMQDVDTARVAALVDLMCVLHSALREWDETYLLYKLTRGEVTDTHLEQVVRDMRSRNDRGVKVLEAVTQTTDRSMSAHPRGMFHRLLTNGLVVGEREDEKNLKVVTLGRQRLQKLSKDYEPFGRSLVWPDVSGARTAVAIESA